MVIIMKQLFIFSEIIMIMIIIIPAIGNSIETDILLLIIMTITTLTYMIDILFLPMLHSSTLIYTRRHTKTTLIDTHTETQNDLSSPT